MCDISDQESRPNPCSFTLEAKLVKADNVS